MRSNQNQVETHPIFFKQFIHKHPRPSPRNNTTFHHQPPHRPQNSSFTAINKIINQKRNSPQKDKQPENQDRFLRKSVTQENKRQKVNTGIMPKELSLIFKVLKSKTTEFVRTKDVAQQSKEENEGEQKCKRVAKLNEKFKEKREKTLARMFNQTSHSKSQVTNYVSNIGSIVRNNSTLPLHSQYKSYKALQPKVFDKKPPFQVSQSSECLQSNLLNPQANNRKSQGKRREGCDSAKRFYLKLKKNKIGLLFCDPNDNQNEEETINRQAPSELGINKIMLPKRNYRHQFLQNIQKIKEGYLKIKGNGQKQPPTKPYFHQQNRKPTQAKKTYQIKYRKISPRKEEKILRSKTEFFHNRIQWESFINGPLSPWDTQQPKGM